MLGWLAGDDFGRAICIAVNCGQDTDCTGATLGALLGILDPDGIDDRWLKPIGRELVLSPCIAGIDHPPTLDGFTDLVLGLRDRLDAATTLVLDHLADTSHLGISATVGFLSAMPDQQTPPSPPANARPVCFSGNWATLPTQACADRVALVRYVAAFNQARDVQLMFSSPHPVRVWLDDQLVIDSPGGQFVPAVHRTRPRECSQDLPISPGTHRITAAVERRDADEPLQWVIAFADTSPRKVERSWLIDHRYAAAISATNSSLL